MYLRITFWLLLPVGSSTNQLDKEFKFTQSKWRSPSDLQWKQNKQNQTKQNKQVHQHKVSRENKMNVVQIQHYLTNRIQLSLWSAWSCNVGSGVTIKGLDKVSSQQANCYFKTTCSWFKWVTQTQMQTCVQENMCELLRCKCKHWCKK